MTLGRRGDDAVRPWVACRRESGASSGSVARSTSQDLRARECRVLAERRQSCSRRYYVSTFRGFGVGAQFSVLPASDNVSTFRVGWSAGDIGVRRAFASHSVDAFSGPVGGFRICEGVCVRAHSVTLPSDGRGGRDGLASLMAAQAAGLPAPGRVALLFGGHACWLWLTVGAVI
jgi:hypothetical protein